MDIRLFLTTASAAMLGCASPAFAHGLAIPASAAMPTNIAALLMRLQCVPYARQTSGIRIFGDAHTWWSQAAGHYARGFTPKVGAVMAFHRHGKMTLGHVATVSRIIDSRTVLLRHANWSPINGRTGQIEDNVKAIDVSPHNDWSKVRVWFGPLNGLGGTSWPIDGFIYNHKPRQGENSNAHEETDGDPIGAIIAAFSRSQEKE